MTTNVTTQDLQLILESYKAWRFLNATLSHFASRTVNFPEAISESLCCYQLGYQWHNNGITRQILIYLEMRLAVMESWLK